MYKAFDTLSAYSEATAFIEKLVFFDRLLPDQVFRTPHSRFSMISYDLMLTGLFWRSLKALRVEDVGDSVLIYSVLPSGASTAKSGVGYFGAIELKLSATEEEYADAIDHSFTDNPLDCLNIISSVIAIAPRAGNWIAWGDRGWEICILSHDSLPTSELGEDWAMAQHALKWFAFDEQLKRGNVEFHNRFLQNYGA